MVQFRLIGIKEANRLNKLGTKASVETRKKMSESQKGKHNSPRKPLTPEQRKRVSTAMLNAHITRSNETREKIGASKRGKHYITINGKKKLVSADFNINVGL